MSYIRTHNITKTLLALLLGLPFVLGVFSNVRPADAGPLMQQSQVWQTTAPQALFAHIPTKNS